MKNVLTFLTKNIDYAAFSLNLRIFDIYLLCIKQNYIKEVRIIQEQPKSILLI